MFGLFFDKINSKRKKSEDKPKEMSPRPQPKPTVLNTSPGAGPRINSLSPTSHNTQQFYFQQYSPQSTSNQHYFKPTTDFKKAPITTSNFTKKIDDSNTNIVTSQSNSQIVVKASLATEPETKKEKPKPRPNFEFRPLDKDSFSQNMGSITESTQEGSVLAQNLPPPKSINASKIPVKLIKKEDPYNMTFKVKNKDTGEVYDIREFSQKKENDQYDIKNKYGISLSRRQQAWQDWWNERKKNNVLLLDSAKFGDVDTCIKLLDKKKGDLKADVNTKGDNDWTPLHFACLNGNHELVNLLLFNEANIDAETTLKFTPLIISSQKGHDEVVQLLINSGADINSKDIYNNTSLHYAAQNGHKKIVQILLSKPSISLTIRNNDNKLASELTDSKDIKKLFEMFISEKSILNSKYTQKVTIHTTKNDSIKKMFENIIDDSAYKNLNKKSNDSDSSDQQKHSSYGETKANSSLNTSDSDISNNASNGEEERIGPHSFIVHSMIGKGSFGEVYLVEKKSTKTVYAMKVLNKNKIQKHNLIKYALTERNVLSLTNHPFIVKLNWAFQTPEKLFLILDYAPGGDLGEHLQKERRFNEERARIYLAEIILALEDLHKRDIIFRDLKPDNIVLDEDGHAMLTDFGLSKEGVLDHTQGAKSFCGSVAYLAPEMLKRVGHGKAVDWYLLGVVFYEMLVGVPPYYANNREQLFYNIEKAPLKIPSYLSTEAKSLLKGLLQRNPTKRLGSGKGDSEEVKNHPYFSGLSWKDVENKKLKPPVPEKKIKLSAKIPLNVFDTTNPQNDKDRISGWSFVAPNQN